MKKNYYYNSKTDESVWELPEKIKKLAGLYYKKKTDHQKKLK